MKTVTAAIIKQGDKYLITQRPRNDKLALKWEFPGGKVKEGESPEECLKREIKEELNLDIVVKERFATSIYEYDTGVIELAAYFADIVGGALKLLIHNDVQWVNSNHLSDYEVCPADVAIVECILEKESVAGNDVLNGSIEYYNSNADKYCNNTLNVDMSKIYHSFLQHLPPSALILDAGCGSGRDSLYFLNQGCRVVAFDGSSEIVKKSSELTGLPVEHCTFEEFHSREHFDAIWACASLLHVEKEQLTEVIKHLTRYLKEGGIFYMSYKYGDRDYEKDGRHFSCFKEEEFKELIAGFDELDIIELFQTVDVRKDRHDEYWLNCLLKRVD